MSRFLLYLRNSSPFFGYVINLSGHKESSAIFHGPGSLLKLKSVLKVQMKIGEVSRHVGNGVGKH